ncbi:hypothetical protein [Nocardia sp. NPDC059229]|uniref:hypothetical protein n=1 Tax=Nocardia sp. NPDC059229 TaxID=3346778 RepID=UPI0036BD2679
MAGAKEQRSTADPLEIRVVIGGERASRDRVLAWESRRARAVLAKFETRLGPRAFAELTPAHTATDLRHATLDRQRAALTTFIGGVRHQFRDRDGGMEALLTVQFPGGVPHPADSRTPVAPGHGVQ